ncbi:MAG TPA: dTDP-4-dehydrorhamnose reductase [Micromonosporaceae bacterium]
MTAPVRWLLLGAGGMLGRDLREVLAADAAVELTAATRAEVDVTDPHAVRAAVPGHQLVVNAAAWTDVDAAEAEPERALAANGEAVGRLAQVCHASGARLLHLSTDYVFAGDATAPYLEDSPTAPVNRYGESKLRGEQLVRAALPADGYVIRTAWLYGEHGRNFVATMLRLARERDSVDVVRDQRGQPTWSMALARQLVRLGHAALAGQAPAGVYHGTAAGETTWYDFARDVFALAGLDPNRVRPTTSDRFVRPARRPAYSVLSHGRWAVAGLTPMAPWRDMLAEALARPGFADLVRAAQTG